MVTTAPNDRLMCCVCQADLGDANDPYADPDCIDCLHHSVEADLREDDEIPTPGEIAEDERPVPAQRERVVWMG